MYYSRNTISSQSGFTLVELVVVIVILGILAATALPRFVSVASDARLAAVNGMAGGLRSAVALAQSKYAAAGSATATTVALSDGTTAVVSAGANGGIPTVVSGAVGGIGTMMGCESASACRGFTWTQATTVSATFTPSGGPVGCNVVYTAATGVVTTNTTC